MWIVALLPEPWKARSVGLGDDMLGGVRGRVKKDVGSAAAAIQGD